MTNYSAKSSSVVKRWRKGGYLYCAFIDGTIMEYGLHRIPNRYVEVDRFELHETIYELKNGEYDFDDLEPMEV